MIAEVDDSRQIGLRVYRLVGIGLLQPLHRSKRTVVAVEQMKRAGQRPGEVTSTILTALSPAIEQRHQQSEFGGVPCSIAAARLPTTIVTREELYEIGMNLTSKSAPPVGFICPAFKIPIAIYDNGSAAAASGFSSSANVARHFLHLACDRMRACGA